MSVIKCIYTNRLFNDEAFYDLVYEWEDVLSAELGIPLVGLFDNWSLSGIRRLFTCIFRRMLHLNNDAVTNIVFFPSKCGLKFYMGTSLKRKWKSANIIPWIIDFYLSSNDELTRFNEVYKHYPLVLISSKEAYSILQQKAAVVKDVRFAHCGLSLSDVYKISAECSYKKIYDVALMGRQNPLLEKFFYQYVESHPAIKYVYRKQKGKEFLYFSCENGKETLIGDINNRDKYIALMRSVRIGLYATPGIDRNVHGYNQVTPRLLELLSCKAHVIARYTDNPDTEYYEMQRLSPSINIYEEFEQAMDYAMTHNIDETLYVDYLQKHYTSVRARELKEIIENHG